MENKDINTKTVVETTKFKVEWKEVLSNKVTLTAFVVALIGLIYYTATLLGYTLPIEQEAIIKWCGMIIAILSMLGIVTNSNTKGGGK